MPEEVEKKNRSENESIDSEYEEIESRLDRMDEKVEFVRAEVAQRTGRKIGREMGILYGVIAALILMLLIFAATDHFSFALFIRII